MKRNKGIGSSLMLLPVVLLAMAVVSVQAKPEGSTASYHVKIAGDPEKAKLIRQAIIRGR